MPTRVRLTVLILMAVLFHGCLSGQKPLEMLTYEAQPRNTGLIVFLRGMGGAFSCIVHSNACFETEGFVQAVRSRALPFDMVAPDSHYGYYKDRTLEDRIRSDIILPARSEGYRNIWLVGVSMGGLGALLYLRKHPEDIDGVLTLGPYLGSDAIIDEIVAAGGPANWVPGNYDPREDWQRMLWDWLKTYPHQAADRPPIYIGIGDQDPYYRGQKLLADYLPPGHAIFVPGGHWFSTFKTAWVEFLDRGLLQ